MLLTEGEGTLGVVAKQQSTPSYILLCLKIWVVMVPSYTISISIPTTTQQKRCKIHLINVKFTGIEK